MKYIAWLLISSFISCSGPIARLSFESGSVPRDNLPIYFGRNLDLQADSDYYLKNTVNGRVYPVQVTSRGPVTLINDFPANTTLHLDLKAGRSLQRSTHVKLEENSQGIVVRIADKPVMFYQSETTGPNGDHPAYYRRSGFIHPLYSPNGEILTDGFPKGHTHQNGIFNAWTHTTFKGKKVDFWNRQEELGTIKHTAVISASEGTVSGQIIASLSHISLEHGEVLNEEWQITIYPVSDYYLFDLQSIQVNTSQDTLFLHEYLYGGMAFRGSKEWNKEDVNHFTNPWKILTNDGFDNETANHTQAAWVDASGTINGKKAGLTVFGYPDNFRAPQAIRVHPDMPYWVFSPVVEGDFIIAPGQKYVSRYRYLAHDGNINLEELERVKSDLENPLKVRLLK